MNYVFTFRYYPPALDYDRSKEWRELISFLLLGSSKKQKVFIQTGTGIAGKAVDIKGEFKLEKDARRFLDLLGALKGQIKPL